MNFRFVLFLFFVFLLSSCSDNRKQDKENMVFRYNESSNIATLDPAFARTQAEIWIANQLFNGLVQLDDSLNIQPDIAKKWTVSQDGKRYVFTLRNDVFFHKSSVFAHNTRFVKASDFEYSFSRLADKKTASPGSWIMRNVKNFKAVNDTLFEINLEKPFPAFLGLLTMKYASAVPKEGFEKGYNFRKNPIGTGAFTFKLWEENVKLVLRKNPNYFEKDSSGNPLPYLEAVAVTFLPDKQSGFLQFVQGKSDFISGLDASYKDEILTPKGELQEKYRKNFKMLKGSYLNTEYLGFKTNNSNSPVSDKRIRQALNYGFDRTKMVAYLRNNMGTAATNGFVPDGLHGRYLNGYDYDLPKAKELVEEYKSEAQTRSVTITLSTNASYLDIAEYLQREWQKIGIEVKIDIMPNSALRQGMATGKVDFFRGSWIADYPDAENYLSLFYSKNQAPNGPNYTHFKNEHFDYLYEKSFLETNNQKRFELYRKMDSIVISQAPIIPLFYDKAVRFTSKNIEGLGINPLNSLHLKKVRKSGE
ncbi:MAG: ABC transporter substrate-binding protein [Flavobacteriaceae bacterium]